MHLGTEWISVEEGSPCTGSVKDSVIGHWERGNGKARWDSLKEG